MYFVLKIYFFRTKIKLKSGKKYIFLEKVLTKIRYIFLYLNDLKIRPYYNKREGVSVYKFLVKSKFEYLNIYI